MKDRTITEPPTIMDRRAPWITRLHASRPTWSVPNQCSPVGRARRALTSSTCGSTPAIRGAPSATSTFSATRTAPSTALRRRRKTRSSRMLAKPDAGVDGEVGQVHEEVDGGIGQRDEEHHALDHGIVSAQDGGDDEPAQPGD